MDETPNTPTPTTIWNKKADELTVGDAMVMNGVMLIATIGTIAGLIAVGVVYDKLAKRKARKAEKEEAKNIETNETTDLTVVED